MGRASIRQWMALGLLCALSGCASTPYNPADPYQKSNRSMDDFNDAVDRNVLKPVANGYTAALPQPVRQCLHNAFDNLTYFETILNGALQGKSDQAGGDALRMLLNSTVGLAGLFDPATELGLKRHDEDFGLTLGVWGVKQGDYLVLPFLGPTTTRDVWSWPVAVVTDPMTWVDAPLAAWLPLDAVRVVDFRASAENEIHFRDAAALDPYVFTREAYLSNRRFRLTGSGAATTQPAIDYYEDEGDAGTTTRPTTQPATRSTLAR